MSHFIAAKLSIKNDYFMKKALTKMGLSFEEGNFKITQYGRTENAQIKFENALGLQKQQDGSWMLVGDPYHCNDQKLRKYYGNQNFDKDLKVNYAIVETTEQLEQMNFNCIESTENDKEVRMVFESLTY